VFTIKHCPNDTVDKYKARLVARGLTQTCDVDYLETSSLVACLNSIRVLFSLAVNYQWSMFQLDVKIVFLYSDLRRKSIWSNPLGIFLRGRIWCASSRRQYMALSKVREPALKVVLYHLWSGVSKVLLWSLYLHSQDFYYCDACCLFLWHSTDWKWWWWY